MPNRLDKAIQAIKALEVPDAATQSSRLIADMVDQIRPVPFLLGPKEHHTQNSDEAGTKSDRKDDATSLTIITIKERDYHICKYLGLAWERHVMLLHNLKAIEIPEGIVCTPHSWQLKGAAQFHYLCSKSQFRGGICGDGMGVGKTLLAILIMELARKESGSFSLVVCTASCQNQWAKEIINAYDEGHVPKILILKDNSIPVSEIINGRYEVLIVSYQFLWRNFSAIQTFKSRISLWQPGQHKPVRPRSVLFSGIWEALKLPIKRLILDEGHLVKKTDGAIHLAVKQLYTHSCLILSGTFMSNKWHDVGGLLQFIRGHPFNTKERFMRAFSGFEYTRNLDILEEDHMKLLQRFLMGLIIARPSEVLDLKDIRIEDIPFELLTDDSQKVQDCTSNYERAIQLQRNQYEARVMQGKSDSKKTPMLHAVLAQLYSIHRILPQDGVTSGNEVNEPEGQIEEIFDQQDDKSPVQPVSHVPEIETLASLLISSFRESVQGANQRPTWLTKLRETPDELLFKSGRLEAFLSLFSWVRKEYPDEKVVVYSTFLKFLDIIDLALLKRMGIKTLRFDGTVHTRDRDRVQQAFTAQPPSVPLLITSGAGGIGINITQASVVIQTEI